MKETRESEVYICQRAKPWCVSAEDNKTNFHSARDAWSVDGIDHVTAQTTGRCT